jgi:hypothetical protein
MRKASMICGYARVPAVNLIRSARLDFVSAPAKQRRDLRNISERQAATPASQNVRPAMFSLSARVEI